MPNREMPDEHKPTRFIYPPGHQRYSTRALELHLAVLDIAFGAIVLLPNWHSMDATTFMPQVSGISMVIWGWCFIIRGFLHAAALYINGRVWWSPWVRAGMSTLSAGFWLSFGIMFVALMRNHQVTPEFLAIYSLVAIPTHFYCARWSAKDAAIASKPLAAV